MSNGPTIDWSKYADKPETPKIDWGQYEEKVQAQLPPPARPGFGEYASTLGSELKGAGKRLLLQPVALISKGLNKIPGIGETLAPSSGVAALDEVSKPQGMAEKFGAGVETVAEMALGEGAIKSALMKIPALAKYAPFVRIIAGAGGAGAPAAVRGENPTVPALFGAGGAALAEAVPAASSFLKKSAAKNYENVLAPTTQANKFTTNKIMPQLQEARPVAVTRQGLADKAAARAEQYGQQIEQKVGTLQGSVDVRPIAKSLEDLRKNFQVNGVSLRPEADAAINSLQEQITNMAQPGLTTSNKFAPTITYQDAVKARRILDQAVQDSKGWQGGNVSDASLTAMRKEFANSLRGELAQAHPDLAKLNAKFSFWNNLSDVMDATIQRKTGQVGAYAGMKTVIAAGAGMASGGVSAAVEAGAAMKVLNSTINSTGWNTVSALNKQLIAGALAAGKFDKVISLLGKAGAAAYSQISTPNATP